VVEDDELRHQNLKKGDMCQIDARHVEGSRPATSPVGQGRRGEGRAVEGSAGAQALPGKESKAVFGQPKHSGREREVAMYGHQEMSAGERRELHLGEPRHISGKGKGDVFASGRV
jgi:hypothetical protein